ncbi:peptide-methionine (R)-S-oxide reductase MsrB [Spirosoma rhododendri]|uniref:peptide-methionine (R)-S-oxide reductase n=1 Tax=Spirosoma rhododendri TaxID=2728024 RepID=A0A7L5DLV5_9BACT|nr:peptide-methionine (R)-S-oxide reductase MsrB [Spirosoma rhododendri]QJD79105.1 peptide-methionine (R)-S-oxide reductase MsrB [Spirosoma rhododendri]
MKSSILFLVIAALIAAGLWGYGTFIAKPRPPHQRPVGATSPGDRRVVKSDADWKKVLDRSAYNVLRNSDTEWAGSSPLNEEHRPGTFVCAACRNPLFRSTAKFESGTGWPSFYQPILSNAIYTEADGNRTEVRCSVCDGHLGHVFEDGPEPTGLRYCMNGVAMQFKPAATQP